MRTTLDPKSLYMIPEDVCLVLGVTERQLALAVRDGLLSEKRLGTRTRYLRVEVEYLLDVFDWKS